jgi:hypothetical protein
MYRQGLGDCFLLTFTYPEPNTDPVHVLIDCGVDWSTKKGSDKIRSVAAKIRVATDKSLDLLVVTHEHWDHVSGFKRAKDEFKAMKPKRVWLAWTEDPEDEFAKSLKAENNLAFEAVTFGYRQLAKNRAVVEDERQRLAATAKATKNVMRFYGRQLSGRLGFSKTSDEAMDFVSSLKKDNEYCSPGGKPLVVESLPGVRFYVLGPPKDKKKLKKMNPTPSDPETYELDSAIGERRAFFHGLQDLAARTGASNVPELLSDTERRRLRNYPFTERNRIGEDTREARELFSSTYFRDLEDWRRIDYDWLTSVSDLALQVDNAVNNTSLVLAIELIESQRVLLFAADAQIGNWLSWYDNEWTVEKGDGTEHTVTTEDLLARTVFYKVGHHGSHNATLKQRGLEKMTSPDLVAMIPVDEKFAHDTKHWEEMPHDPLLARLIEKTTGRVLRADRDWPDDDSDRPEDLSDGQWEKFKGAVTVKDDYIDFDLKS